MHRDQLPIPEPCSADWEGMHGGSRKRFCDQCSKHVHDLSAMTEDEASTVLEEPGVCVRYTVKPDGDIRFRSRRTFLAGAAASLIALPAAAKTASTEESPGLLAWLLDRIEDVFTEEEPLEVLAGEPVVVKAEPEEVQTAPPVQEPDTVVMGDIAVEPPPKLMGKVAVPPEPEPEPPVFMGLPAE
jgi:hypothetical protein